MLKISKNGKLYLITQPDHAQVAGYRAAHRGNDEFGRGSRRGPPGYHLVPVPGARARARSPDAGTRSGKGTS